jgi:hypothetical protein
MRPNIYFDKARCRFVITTFKEQTDHAFTKLQLKNKWDGIKKDWRIWKTLISKIGLSWSGDLKTIFTI